jgi:hypothetical protein
VRGQRTTPRTRVHARAFGPYASSDSVTASSIRSILRYKVTRTQSESMKRLQELHGLSGSAGVGRESSVLTMMLPYVV